MHDIKYKMEGGTDIKINNWMDEWTNGYAVLNTKLREEQIYTHRSNIQIKWMDGQTRHVVSGPSVRLKLEEC